MKYVKWALVAPFVLYGAALVIMFYALCAFLAVMALYVAIVDGIPYLLTYLWTHPSAWSFFTLLVLGIGSICAALWLIGESLAWVLRHTVYREQWKAER